VSDDNELVQCYVAEFLRLVRDQVRRSGLKTTRLPGWVTAAHVTFGWQGQTAVVEIDTSASGSDRFDRFGTMRSDAELIFRTVVADTPSQAHLPGHATGEKGNLTIEGEFDGTSIMKLRTSQSFVDCRSVRPRHHLFCLHLAFQLVHHEDPDQVLGFRFMPLIAYVHKEHLAAMEMPVASLRWLADLFPRYSNSAEGEREEQRQQQVEVFRATKQRTVIVLGSYHPPHSGELASLRDDLKRRGYDAKLISDLPDLPSESNAQKVQNWTSAARFAVMIDRDPAGHLAEYELLRAQQTILALFRPTTGGSSWMIGDDEEVDVNFIRTFHFQRSPLETMERAVEWAERIARKREDAFNRRYPWRRSSHR
jgi:hypothetical protein